MIVGIGTDIVAVSRIEASYTRLGQKFVERILAYSEREAFAQAKQPIALLAKRFAVKEAAGKALGTGIGQGVSWHDICIDHDNLGAPVLELSGKAAEIAAAKYINNMQVSISDEKDAAIAFVILSRDD